MPSGPKKRKAAKKKKINEANNPTSATTDTHDEDLKHQDEKESDGGELSSPASQDHGNIQHTFIEGEDVEVEKKEDSSFENKSIEGAMEEEDTVQIDRELISEGDFGSKNIAIESAKGSRDSSSSRSSSSDSSSSDDESHVVEKKVVAVETNPAVVLVEAADSLPEKVTLADDVLAVESSPTVDLVKPVHYLAAVLPPQIDGKIIAEEANELIQETPSVVDSDKVSLLEQIVHVSYLASDVAESNLKENGEKKLHSLDENNGDPPLLMELKYHVKDEFVVIPNKTTTEYVSSSTYAKDSVSEENENILLPSSNVPTGDPTDVSADVKESEPPQLSETQPLIASAPQTVQPTSWKSCCGLLEVFTGSNRS